MPEKEYSHDPQIWPISQKGLRWVLPWSPLINDEIKAAAVIAEMVLAKLEAGVTAPPKPKPEPEGDADDLPDVR